MTKADTRDAFAAIVSALQSITNEQWLLATACAYCGAAAGEHCHVRGGPYVAHKARDFRARMGINRRGHFAACLAELDTGLVSLPTAFRLLRKDRAYKIAVAAGYLENA